MIKSHGKVTYCHGNSLLDFCGNPVLELYVAHTAQPIHKDTPVPSHAMPYAYTAAAYIQSSYQLATSVTLLRPVT